MFDYFKAWWRRRAEQRWTREVYGGLKKFIGEEKAKEIFKYGSLEEKLRFIKRLRDNTNPSDIIPKP